MAGPTKDDSNIFDFYSSLIHSEPDDPTFGGIEGFAEWNSFDRFCKSLAHSVFQNLGSQGKQDFLEKINACHSYEDIITTADNEQVINITIDMLLQEANDRNIEVKDATEAKRLREEGNGLFKRKDYHKCLNVYSKAISLAPDDHVEFVLSLANRSATFLHLSQFEDSLQDIDLVLEKETYPEDRLYIVYGRKIQCLKALGRHEEAKAAYEQAVKSLESLVQDASHLEMNKDVLKTSLEKEVSATSRSSSSGSRRRIKTTLDDPPNLKIPCASKKLTVSFDSTKGRHITAAEDIQPSEVLFVEKPYAFWMKPSANEDFCLHCLRYLSGKHFIPCTSCSSRFCSKNCFDEATDRYHWLECKFMDVFSIVSSGHLAIRVILQAGLEKSLEMFVAHEEAKKKSTKAVEEVYHSDYKSILNLVDHLKERSAEDMTAFAVASLFTAKLVNQIINFDTNPLAALIFKHILQISCNVIGIDFDPNDPEATSGGQQAICSTLNSQTNVIAIGLFPTTALLNHSCDRVTYRIFVGGTTLCLKSYDTIKTGQEITFNYGPFDRRMSRKDRREVLKKNFFFDCECRSCVSGIENLGSSFACPYCGPEQGSIIVNWSDRSSYCTVCLRGDSLDIDAVEERVEQLRPQLQLIWDSEVFDQEGGNLIEAEFALNSLIKNYSKYISSKSYRMVELKERLAAVYEMEKKMRDAMKLWLECFYTTRLLEGEDNYDCLCFLLKITQGLVQEADEFVNEKQFDKLKVCLEKIQKYFKRAVLVSKKLKGREGKLLEARDEILHNIPDLKTVSQDIQNLTTLANMI